jgi:hypothetical protein
MVTTAEKKDVKELLSGKINSAQFARIIWETEQSNISSIR